MHDAVAHTQPLILTGKLSLRYNTLLTTRIMDFCGCEVSVVLGVGVKRSARPYAGPFLCKCLYSIGRTCFIYTINSFLVQREVTATEAVSELNKPEHAAVSAHSLALFPTCSHCLKRRCVIVISSLTLISPPVLHPRWRFHC